MDVSATLWSELHLDILDQVLSFLPVPDLCRYRTVCKRWDQLACNPKFRSMCARNASKGDASFIVMHNFCIPQMAFGWCFLDLNARRWYTVKLDLGICKDLRGRFGIPAGMDGNLVCQLLHLCNLSKDGYMVVVYNPIAKTRRILPLVPRYLASAYSFPKLTVVVDNVSQSFKIFNLNHNFDTEAWDNPDMTLEEHLLMLNEPLMRVYDSVTNKWNSSTNPSCVRFSFGLASSVMFQGLLYVVFLPSRGEKGPLWRYTLVEDAWENLALPISNELQNPELVMSANRLFLVAFRGGFDDDDERLQSLQISELKIPDMTRDMLFEASNADFVGVKDFQASINIRSICVGGVGNSLLFMCKSTGILAEFNLVARSWGHDSISFRIPPLQAHLVGWEANESPFALYALVAGRSRCR